MKSFTYGLRCNYCHIQYRWLFFNPTAGLRLLGRFIGLFSQCWKLAGCFNGSKTLCMLSLLRLWKSSLLNFISKNYLIKILFLLFFHILVFFRWPLWN